MSKILGSALLPNRSASIHTHILFRTVNNFTFPHLIHVPFSAPTGTVNFGGLVLPVLNLVSNFATLDGIFTVVPCGL